MVTNSNPFLTKRVGEYDKSIHSNPDADAWARFYKEHHPECDLDEMRGWFANAMMAMHDSLLGEVKDVGMTIVRAIKSGKPFKRADDKASEYLIVNPNGLLEYVDGRPFGLTLSGNDIIAEDWVVLTDED